MNHVLLVTKLGLARNVDWLSHSASGMFSKPSFECKHYQAELGSERRIDTSLYLHLILR
jgi:hypothetical protein